MVIVMTLSRAMIQALLKVLYEYCLPADEPEAGPYQGASHYAGFVHSTCPCNNEGNGGCQLGEKQRERRRSEWRRFILCT